MVRQVTTSNFTTIFPEEQSQTIMFMIIMMIIKTHKDVVTPFTNDPADIKGLRAKQPRIFLLTMT